MQHSRKQHFNTSYTNIYLGISIGFRKLAAAAVASFVLIHAAPLVSTPMRDFKGMDNRGLVEAISMGKFTAKVFCEDEGQHPAAIILSYEFPPGYMSGDNRFYLPSMLDSISALETGLGVVMQVNGHITNIFYSPDSSIRKRVQDDLSFVLTYDRSCGDVDSVNGANPEAMRKAISELKHSAEFIRENLNVVQLGGATYIVSPHNKGALYTKEMMEQVRGTSYTEGMIEQERGLWKERKKNWLLKLYDGFAKKFVPIAGFVIAPFLLIGIVLLVRKAIKKAKESLRIARKEKERKAREREELARQDAERRAQRRADQRRRDAERMAAEGAARQERLKREDEVKKMKDESRRKDVEGELRKAEEKQRRREAPEREKKAREHFELDIDSYWAKLYEFKKKFEDAKTLDTVLQVGRERHSLIDEINAKYPDESLWRELRLVLDSTYRWRNLAMTRVTGNPEWAEKRT